MSEECCSIPAPGGSPSNCPSCGARGKPVGTETLTSLLKEPTRAGADEYRFCPAKACDVVYFGSAGPSRFLRTDLTVPVWQKEGDPSCPVCYCFNHSASSIGDELRRTGQSTVLADIKQKVKDGLCACESKNPQGSCCLGNVGAVVLEQSKKFSADSVSTPSSKPPPALSSSEESSASRPCCGVDERSSSSVAPAVAAKTASGTSWLLAGSVGAALVASACCWLPLVLVGLGLSAAGVGAVFERWRPLFLILTAVLLAAGFYLSYFRQEACEPGSSCALPDPKTRSLGRVGLWLATFLVIATAAFPYYAGALTGATQTPVSATAGSVTRQVALSVGGMSCEACTAHVRKALLSVPGVLEAAVDYPSKTARVGLAATGPAPSLQELSAAVRKAGYQARPLTAGRAQPADPCCAF